MPIRSEKKNSQAAVAASKKFNVFRRCRRNAIITSLSSFSLAALYLDVLHPGGLERVPDVLRLRRGLRAPADDAHVLDPLPGLGQLGELVAPAAVDELLEAGELDLLLLEDLCVELELGGHGGERHDSGRAAGRGAGRRSGSATRWGSKDGAAAGAGGGGGRVGGADVDCRLHFTGVQ